MKTPTRKLWSDLWLSLWIVGLGLHLLGVMGDTDSHRFAAWWVIVFGGILFAVSALRLLLPPEDDKPEDGEKESAQ